MFRNTWIFSGIIFERFFLQFRCVFRKSRIVDIQTHRIGRRKVFLPKEEQNWWQNKEKCCKRCRTTVRNPFFLRIFIWITVSFITWNIRKWLKTAFEIFNAFRLADTGKTTWLSIVGGLAIFENSSVLASEGKFLFYTVIILMRIFYQYKL